jgi:starch-binding outer membrane protein, SusD/RagB family
MKFLKLFIIPLFTFIVYSCTDLEEHPVGVLAPESFFKTEKDVLTAIYGAYGKIAADDYWGREISLAISLRDDMVNIGNRGTVAARIQINDFNCDASNALISRFWPASYSIIGTVNIAIEGAGVLQEGDTKNALIAEARFIRAFAYFNLVRLFGDIPYIDKAIKDPESVKTISKMTADEVYSNIIADLEFAKENLPLEHPQNIRSRPSKGSAYTMLADVYLTTGNWQNAYDNAKWVIDNASDLHYELEPDYQNLFDATKQDGMMEHIFAIDFKGLESSWPYNIDSHPAFTGIGGSEKNGWDVEVPSLEVYTTWDARDYRRKVALADSAYFEGVLKPYSQYTIARPHIAKYWRYPGNSAANGSDSDNNYAIYRFAEVLLTAAEALNEISGPTEEALEYVNRVRERARNWNGTPSDFPPNVTAGISKDDFRTFVLDERRIELSFEFKRWWDIKRRQLGEVVFKGPNSLEPHSNFNSDQYLLPIPQDELDRNPNLAPQNSGY